VLESYLLRLVTTEAAHGRLVGEIEDVRSGETRVVRGARELAEAVRELQRARHPSSTEEAPCPEASLPD
jgi:hypothetical protein